MARFYYAQRGKVTVRGIEFDTELEALRLEFLEARERAGEITGLVRQPGPFPIIPRTVGPDGAVHRAAVFTPDFAYTLGTLYVIEDCGFDAASSLRVRALASLHPDWLIRVVKASEHWPTVRIRAREPKAATAALPGF